MPPPEIPTSRSVPKRSKARSRSLRRDAGALVEDLEVPAVAVRLPRPDRHGAAGRAVARGVVEEVGDELAQARGIAVDDEPGRVDLEHVGDVLPAHPRLGDGGVQQRADLDRLAVQRRPAGVDAREVEQVGDQVRHPFALVERGAQRGGVGRGDAVGEVLQHGAQGGQRRPELVADVGDQLAALAVDPGELLGHRVERPRQLADLVARGGRDAHVVVAGGHPARGRGHLAQWRGHADGEELGDGERHGDGHGDAQPDRDAGARADGRDHRGERDAGADQDPELDLDRADRVEGADAHVPAPMISSA